MGENAHARVETRVLKKLACRNGFLDLFSAMVDSVSVRFKKRLACRKNAFKHSFLQWNAGTACVSECVLKTLLTFSSLN